MTCADISEEIKATLKLEFAKLDPIELQKQIEHQQDLLWQYAYRPPMLLNESRAMVTASTALNEQNVVIPNQIDRSSNSSPEAERLYRTIKKPRQHRSMPRYWRTRKDPFALVWPQIQEQLEGNPGLEAKGILQALQHRYPGVFNDGHLRTLQRRVRQWRLDRAVFCDGVIMPVQKEIMDGAIAPTNI